VERNLNNALTIQLLESLHELVNIAQLPLPRPSPEPEFSYPEPHHMWDPQHYSDPHAFDATPLDHPPPWENPFSLPPPDNAATLTHPSFSSHTSALQYPPYHQPQSSTQSHGSIHTAPSSSTLLFIHHAVPDLSMPQPSATSPHRHESRSTYPPGQGVIHHLQYQYMNPTNPDLETPASRPSASGPAREHQKDQHKRHQWKPYEWQ